VRIAIVSDIHGNVRGLDACLADLAEQGGADRIVGAGDFCLDGPRPSEVLQRLVDVGATCVKGNTDRYIADAMGEDENERDAVVWQRGQLGAQWIDWLGALPFSLTVGDGPDALLVVHANPQCDDMHVWPDAADAVLERMMDGVEQRTVAFGHLHLPYVRVWRDRLFVNVASAGLPKDGDPRACYALLTQRPGGWEVKHRRVAFDVDKVAREIGKSGMPEANARIETLRRHRYKRLVGQIP
jgi:predicted phosphodiesterase